MFKSDYYLSLPWNVHASDGKSGIINAEKDGQDSDTTFDLYLLNCHRQKSVISYDYIKRGGKQTVISLVTRIAVLVITFPLFPKIIEMICR